MNREGFIFLKPVFKEMIWGGNRLATEFGTPYHFLRSLAMIYRGMTRESAGESVLIRMAIVPL